MNNLTLQHEIKERHALLDENGYLVEPGYTKGLLMDYDRKAIKGGAMRIKEWDYYLIASKDFAVALTIDDNSYMGLDSVSLLNFKEGWEITNSPMVLFPMGKRNFPPSSAEGDIAAKGKKYELSFEHKGDHRILSFRMDNFKDGKPVNGVIRLDNPKQDSMVICTPYKEKKTAFYYNQKIVCMPASGYCEFDGVRYEFDPERDFGLLDWGRGVWTYKNTWYWGAAQGVSDGHIIGWNIGYGFGDTSAASENMVFYDGVAHKLSQVSFNIPKTNGTYTTRGSCCTAGGKKVDTMEMVDDFMSPWTFTSDDGRFEMDFVPVLDRASNTDFKILGSDQHQVFGLFTGKMVLDDGQVVEVRDFPGFAEKVMNKW